MDLNNKEKTNIELINFDNNDAQEEKTLNAFLKDLNICIKYLENVKKDVYIYIINKTIDVIGENAPKVKFSFYNNYKYVGKDDINISVFRGEINSFIEKYKVNNFILKNDISLQFFFHYPKKPIINCEKEDKKNNDLQKLNVSPVTPRYSFEQMILNDETRSALLSSVTMIKNLSKIYDEWGFSEIDPVQKSVLNFYGPPGTGKTMAAYAVADYLKKLILPLNYADIESKFVGDAPKNLVSAFDIAKKENCVLFFDEADSFLGKRITNVSSSSDQAVNSLRSQMLILLESFEGIVLFATNLHKNYDKAFESRILRNIKFSLPDKELRKVLILKMIPSKAPIDRTILTDSIINQLSDYTEGSKCALLSIQNLRQFKVC